MGIIPWPASRDVIKTQLLQWSQRLAAGGCRRAGAGMATRKFTLSYLSCAQRPITCGGCDRARMDCGNDPVRFGLERPSRVTTPTDLASLPALSIRPAKADQAPDELAPGLAQPAELHARLLGHVQKHTLVKHQDDNCFGWYVSLENEHRFPAPFYFFLGRAWHGSTRRECPAARRLSRAGNSGAMLAPPPFKIRLYSARHRPARKSAMDSWLRIRAGSWGCLSRRHASPLRPSAKQIPSKACEHPHGRRA